MMNWISTQMGDKGKKEGFAILWGRLFILQECLGQVTSHFIGNVPANQYKNNQYMVVIIFIL